jgi:hypothetical protein
LWLAVPASHVGGSERNKTFFKIVVFAGIGETPRPPTLPKNNRSVSLSQLASAEFAKTITYGKSLAR